MSHIHRFSPIVLVFASVASGTGLFLGDGERPYPFETLHGSTVQVNGQGLYHSDTLFFGAGFKGQDAVVLFLTMPLLAVVIRLVSILRNIAEAQPA